MDTPTPFIQLQGTIFKGRHDMLLGTELIFTDDKGEWLFGVTCFIHLTGLCQKESHDWSKRSVTHLANTEQRIAFQEVTLIPKSSKGKEKADVEIPNLEPPPGDSSNQIDRMTGVSAPLTRAPRSRKTASDAKSSSKREGKQPAKATRKSTTALAMPTPHPPEVASTSGGKDDNDNDMDDMYVDTE